MIKKLKMDFGIGGYMVTRIPICNWHKKKDLPYLQWHEWADRMFKQGQRQKKCSVCGRHFFECEWGEEPIKKGAEKDEYEF